MIELQTKRKLNGEHHILMVMPDGSVGTIGRIWRWPVQYNGKRPGGFGLCLDYVYWGKGKPNMRAGGTTCATKTMKAALELARTTLETCNPWTPEAVEARKPPPPRVQYVAGLVFHKNWFPAKTGYMLEIALIKKNRPEWMAGKFNAVGGKIEPGETPVRAMVREFQEETGVLIPENEWREFCVLDHPSRNGNVHFFTAWTDEQVQSTTDEHVQWYQVHNAVNSGVLMTNLKWLIPLALDPDKVEVLAVDRSAN